MPQLFIMSLEPLETRYTCQWYDHLPRVFQTKLGNNWEVRAINGCTKSNGCSPGGFLDFASTNMWKSEQTHSFFDRLRRNHIEDDAVILFTDAWHPGILQVKYTKDLLKKNWKIISFWHAGSYIPEDPLGQLIEDPSWSLAAERSFYEACDVNVFATQYHLDFFFNQFPGVNKGKALRSGFPMEYIFDIDFPKVEKEDLIVFAARNSPEKHPELFEKLKEYYPQWEFINCQEQGMDKEEYHKTLARAKVVISFAELETMGIVQIEAMEAGAAPLCPEWLCYTEEYTRNSPFLYSPSVVTNGNFPRSFLYHVECLMTRFDLYKPYINEAKKFQQKNFFSCDILIETLKKLN